MSFVHLHVHTQYSIADATTRVDEIAARCKAEGMPAVAFTDHDNLYGAVDFHKACKKNDIKPIYGASLSISARPMGEHVLRTHQINVLAMNQVGYKNLLYLISKAHLLAPNGGHSRIDHALLAERNEGLICLTGNLSGEVSNALLRGQQREAERHLRRYKEIFGDRLYIECQLTSLREHKQVLPQLIALGEANDVPCVASNDVHYMERSQARAHEVLMCIGLQIQARPDPNWLPTTDYFFASPEEMQTRFAAYPELCARTLEVADRCNVELQLGTYFLPQFPIPEGDTLSSYFTKISEQGLQERFAEFREKGFEFDEKPYHDRLAIEIGVIEGMGFPGYFLIVWDFIKWAKQAGIPVGPGRGSGAGSLVAYSLRITDLDPLPYNLLFERFLNPERVSMPDFDIDFCVQRRGEVIQYVADEYGHDRVGQIVTFGTLKAKGAVRDCGRVLGIELSKSNAVAKLVPDQAKNLANALELEPRLRDFSEQDPEVRLLLETAEQLEGAVRQTGMHAAGVVISENPLWEYVPIARGANGENIAMFAKEEVEEAGLVKFDFLGLKNLTMIQFAIDLINEGRAAAAGSEPVELFDITKIRLDSPEAFAVMCRGDTGGIFQMESSGFTGMIKRMAPSEFEDIIAAGALYRPGPMGLGMHNNYIERKHGREKVTVDHPILEPILQETYGVMVYQEQVMQVAREMAGYSLGGADLLRRAMGKKKEKVMVRHRKIFGDGAAEKGVTKEVADGVFDQMAAFASYGFNKSHAAAYGLVTYQTAYLKAHFTTEFYAALLTADKDNTDKVVQYIQDARQAKQQVLPPDLNLSKLSFSVSDGAIRFGLGAVRNVGEGAIESILEAREDGPFKSLFDLCRRVDMRRVNRRVIEALVKCGAMDSFGESRETLWENITKAIQRSQEEQKERDTGQGSLFGALGGGSQGIKVDDAYRKAKESWTLRQTLESEKEVLGFYVTGHPLDRYSSKLYRLSCRSLAAARDPAILRSGKRGRVKVLIAAMVSSYREIITRAGKRMAFVTLEDLSGQEEVMCFARTLETAAATLQKGDPLLITLQASADREDPQKVRLILDEAELLDDAVGRLTDYLRISLKAEQCRGATLSDLARLLSESQAWAQARLQAQQAGQAPPDTPQPTLRPVAEVEEKSKSTEAETAAVQGSVFDAPRPKGQAKAKQAPGKKVFGPGQLPEVVERLEVNTVVMEEDAIVVDEKPLNLAPIRLHVRVPGLGVAIVTAQEQMRVAPTAHLIEELERLLGRETVSLG
ncbi:MAG: DNA polymerase III subunit alpha [Myxococcales bacterium]|nr:DNA polymerase III subunit alpha [Myxococcales bacterium]